MELDKTTKSIQELIKMIEAGPKHIEPYWYCEQNGQGYCVDNRTVGNWWYDKERNVFAVQLNCGTYYEFDDFEPVIKTLKVAGERLEQR